MKSEGDKIVQPQWVISLHRPLCGVTLNRPTELSELGGNQRCINSADERTEIARAKLLVRTVCSPASKQACWINDDGVGGGRKMIKRNLDPLKSSPNVVAASWQGELC